MERLNLLNVLNLESKNMCVKKSSQCLLFNPLSQIRPTKLWIQNQTFDVFRGFRAEMSETLI